MVLEKARKIAIYARFSSDKQSDASIEDQVHRARTLVQRSNAGAAAEAAVFSDYATTGASMNRPGMQALLQAIERREVDAVVAESLDRISRDVGDADRFRKLLAHHRVDLVCLDGTQVTRTRGKSDALLYGVRSLFAEQYRMDLADKTLRGLEGRARNGKATGGSPYGYRHVRSENGSAIEIDPESAAIVRRIFAAYASGQGFARIAAALNADGIAPPRAHSRRTCDGWMDSAVRAMLLNERYLGVWTFGLREWVRAPGTGRRVPRARDGGALHRSERPELAIIDAATWQAVQARFAHRGGIARTARVNYPLSGILRCGLCGGLMTCVGGKTRRYGCAVARKRGTCANRASLRVENAEAAFFRVTSERLTAALPEVIELAAQEIAAWSRAHADRWAQIERLLLELDREAANLAAAIASAGALPALLDQLARLETRRAALRAELGARAEPAPVLPHPDAMAKRVTSLKGLRAADPDVVRQFARTALEDERITCLPLPRGYRMSWAVNAWSVLEGKNPGEHEGVAGVCRSSCGGRI